MWDAQEGEQDEKSVFATSVAFNTLMTVVAAAGLTTAGIMNKSAAKALESNTVWIGSLVLIVALGYVLLARKDWRENATVSFWCFVIWAASLATFFSAAHLYYQPSRLSLSMQFSKLVAFLCIYMATSRNKKIENLPRNMVSGFVMAMLIIIVGICLVEWRSRGEGAIGGALLLTMCMLEAGLTQFYIVFAMLKIQIPAATKDNDWSDTVHYSVRLYIDAIYAIFLVLAMLWDKIWK